MQIAQIDASKLNELGKLFAPLSPQDFTNKIGANNLVSDNLAILAIGIVRYFILEFGVYAFMVSILVSGAIYIFSFGKEETVTRAKNALLYSFIGFAIFISANAGLNFYIKRLEQFAALADNPNSTLGTLVGDLFNAILVVAGIGFMVVFFYSGLRYFFSGGNEEPTANARRGMLYAFIGMIVASTAYAMSVFIIKKVLLIGS